MRFPQWLGLSAAVAASIGCENAQQPPQAQTTIDQANKAIANAESQIAQVEAKTKELDELLRAYETLRSTGATIESAPNSHRVLSVDLRDIEVTDALAEQISQLTTLEKLTITQSAMTLEGWQTLGKLEGLQQIDLRDCQLNNDQLKAIVSGKSKLKALRLNGISGRTSVDDSGLEALASCPELKVLAIDGLWVGASGLAHLKGNAKLTELYAARTTIDDSAAEMIAQLPALRKLRLSKTTIGTSGISALSALPLEDLDVSEASGISDETLETIGRMQSLKRLNLWRDTITDTGVAHLSGLTELEWLNLDNTHLADAGLPHLANMKQLKFLHLGSTGVTDAGMPALVALTALKDLKVTRTAVTEPGVEVIRQAIPGIDIQLKYIEGE